MGIVGKGLAYTNPIAWPVALGVVLAVFLRSIGKAMKVFDDCL